jgi:pimeloyl-ACP methyl ester carboxylesterase
MRAPFERVWTPVDGKPMRAWTAGQASSERPVVLVPGLGLSGTYLRPLGRELAATRRVYVVDLPGAGGSPGRRRTLAAGDLGHTLAAWLSARGLGPVVAVGNSLGSEIVLEAARRQPQRIAGVVLCSPTPDPRNRSLAVHGLRLLRAGARVPLWLALVAVRDYARTGPIEMLRAGRAAVAEPVRDRLEQLAAPALIVRGADDPVVPQDWAEQAARHARAPLEVIPGAGHAAVASHPAEVGRLVVRFAGTLAQRPETRGGAERAPGALGR